MPLFLELRPLLYSFKRLHAAKKAMDDLVTHEGYASSYVEVFATDLERTGAKCWPKQVSGDRRSAGRRTTQEVLGRDKRRPPENVSTSGIHGSIMPTQGL